jgi:hypothetical protein
MSGGPGTSKFRFSPSLRLHLCLWPLTGFFPLQSTSRASTLSPSPRSRSSSTKKSTTSRPRSASCTALRQNSATACVASRPARRQSKVRQKKKEMREAGNAARNKATNQFPPLCPILVSPIYIYEPGIYEAQGRRSRLMMRWLRRELSSGPVDELSLRPGQSHGNGYGAGGYRYRILGREGTSIFLTLFSREAKVESRNCCPRRSSTRPRWMS